MGQTFLCISEGSPTGRPVAGLQPWGANSFRLRWVSPGFSLDDELPFTPFLDAPLSDSEFSVDVSPAQTDYTNGNLRVTVDSSTGYFVATRLSDGKTIYTQRNLSYAPAMLPGIPPSAQITLDGPAPAETLVGMGEQGLTGRVTLQFPFNRVFQDTEYYPYNQGRQAFFPLYFSSAGYGALFSLPSYGWLNLDHGASNFVVNSSSVRVLDVWITCTPDTPVYEAGSPHPFLALLKQVGARSCTARAPHH